MDAHTASTARRAVLAAATIAIAASLALPSPAPASPSAAPLAVPILMYHRIDHLRPGLPLMTRRLTVDPDDFARQMEWLHVHGYHTLTQEQLLAAATADGGLPPRPILITFDDGYRDVLGKAAPVLARLKMHATAYVISGRLHGADPSFLTVPELRALERLGIEIGSHTATHAALTALGDAQASEELVSSRRVLEAAVGHPVRWFAYPYGAYDARTAALVARAGYRLAVTTQPGLCQDAGRPLELRRFEILDSTGVGGLAAMLRAGC
ncbi:MAG TPA: polysaccharide deacetylase family protein [Gaiellaceae bacterium]|nr:polysaccharide deacetylase family protein [Gaiellaceae bacterium]